MSVTDHHAGRIRLRREQARQREEQGEDHIRKQRHLIAELERDGHDVTAAKRLLTNFEETQVLHKEQC
jgi:hypothetical protein